MIIGVVASAATSIWVLRKQAMEDWKRQLSGFSLILAENTAQQFTTAYLALDGTVERLKELGITSESDLRAKTATKAVFEILKYKLESSPQIDVVSIVASDGELLNYSRHFPPKPINLAERDYFKAHRDNPSLDVLISAPVQNKGNGKWTFYISRRLNGEHGQFIGMVLLGISVDFYTEFYHKVGIDGKAYISLYRDDFLLLARWPQREGVLGKHNLDGSPAIVVKRMKKLDDVIVTASPRFTKGGSITRPRMVAVRTVEKYPLIVVIGIEEETYLSEWRNSALIIGGIATGTVLSLAFAFILLIRINRRRERDLVLTLELKRQAEFNNRVKSRLLDNLAEKQEALRDSNTRLEALVENAADAIIVLTETGLIESFNKAAESIFGYAAHEVIGKEIIFLSGPQVIASENEGLIAFALRNLPIVGMEGMGKRKNQTIFPIELSINRFAVSNGRKLIAIVRDITERKKVDRMKNEFVSTVSHELRTPLTAIRGALGLVDGGALGALPEAAATLIATAHRSSEHLTLLINDLLDLQKIEAGKLEFNFEIVKLRRLLDDTVSSNMPFATRYEVTLQVDGEIPDVSLNVDPSRFEQVMANLLSNACKYSPRGERVLIRAALVAAEQIRVEIIDKGPGIPDEFRDRLFQKFSQADSSDSRAKEGTGLGLSIVKSIVERMRGSVGVEQPPEGGTIFFIEQPCRPVQHAEENEDAGEGIEAR
ncbi:ATP-binding protein [Noviherbaspirillum galbum]|uniref:histidine kinase n=1 Tax=Noviherbaspirillum galbum TaxID=2709383 RepID=A0A6B3STX7_9BURK|nr:ATP-binding protein [Noviherbaspirillum galbum]NEX62326.1 PAS domain S-box protein [Noviherbaspirillum galbum]